MVSKLIHQTLISSAKQFPNSFKLTRLSIREAAGFPSLQKEVNERFANLIVDLLVCRLFVKDVVEDELMALDVLR